MVKKRGEKGFIQLGEEKREVRSLRVAASTWKLFSQVAAIKGISAGDLFEEMAKKIDHPVGSDDPSEMTKTIQHIDAYQGNPEDLKKAIALLTEALALKPNAGGAIKAKIREALELIQR